MKSNNNNQDQTSQVIALPMSESVSLQSNDLIQKSLEGQEQAYQKLVDLAIRSTLSTDWTEFGDKPYLQQSGVSRIAVRFGLSVIFDRNNNGEPMIIREEFEHEKYGKAYIYTVSGKAVWGQRSFEAIGTASTLDQFLGMEGKGEYRKASPLHESMQDAKKKAVTNFYNNAISQLIGIKGMTWDELSKYGIMRGGKTKVDFKNPTPKTNKPLPKIEGKKPYWMWTSDSGKNYVYVNSGNHFPEDWLLKSGMKKSPTKPKQWGAEFSETLFQELEKQFEKIEIEMRTE